MPTVLRGRVWKFGDDINTDLIQPSVNAASPEERARHCFSANRPGWSSQVQAGDIIIGGRNFGTGSSRPAAANFITLGIACVIAESMNGLFLRNSINLGLPALSVAGAPDAFDEMDEAEVNLVSGTLRNLRSGAELAFAPLPDMVLDVLEHGGLMAVMLERGYVDPPARRNIAHA
jgi:3-isopropylmalate/(R)-2-methylmalate dehydratase small subunit